MVSAVVTLFMHLLVLGAHGVRVFQRPDGLWDLRVGYYYLDRQTTAPTSLVIPLYTNVDDTPLYNNVTLRGVAFQYERQDADTTPGRLGSTTGINLYAGIGTDKSHQIVPTADRSWDPRVTLRASDYTVDGVDPATAYSVSLFCAPVTVSAGTSLSAWFSVTPGSSSSGGVGFRIDVIVQSDAGTACTSDNQCLSLACRGRRCCAPQITATSCTSCDVGGSCNGCPAGQQLSHAMGCVVNRTSDGLYSLRMPGTYSIYSYGVPSSPIPVPMNAVLRGIRLTYSGGGEWNGHFGTGDYGAQTAISIGGTARVIAPNQTADPHLVILSQCPWRCYFVTGVDIVSGSVMELLTAPTLVSAGTHLAMYVRTDSTDDSGTATYVIDLIFESFTGARCVNDSQCPAPDKCNAGTCGVFKGSALQTCAGGTAVPLALTCLLSGGQTCSVDTDCASNSCRGSVCTNMTNATAMLTTRRSDGFYGLVVPGGAMLDAVTGASQTWVAPIDVTVAALQLTYNGAGNVAFNVTSANSTDRGTFPSDASFFMSATSGVSGRTTYAALNGSPRLLGTNASMALLHFPTHPVLRAGASMQIWFNDTSSYSEHRGAVSYSWQVLVCVGVPCRWCASDADCGAKQHCGVGGVCVTATMSASSTVTSPATTSRNSTVSHSVTPSNSRVAAIATRRARTRTHVPVVRLKTKTAPFVPTPAPTPALTAAPTPSRRSVAPRVATRTVANTRTFDGSISLTLRHVNPPSNTPTPPQTNPSAPAAPEIWIVGGDNETSRILTTIASASSMVAGSVSAAAPNKILSVGFMVDASNCTHFDGAVPVPSRSQWYFPPLGLSVAQSTLACAGLCFVVLMVNCGTALCVVPKYGFRRAVTDPTAESQPEVELTVRTVDPNPSSSRRRRRSRSRISQ